MNIETLIQHYIVAALWSTIDEDVYDDGNGPDDSLDARFDASDIAYSAMESIRCDCARFVAKAEAAGLIYRYIANAPDGVGEWSAAARFGHDFWLERVGAGVGFWDREYLPDGLGDALSDLCKEFGETDIYAGDDGKLYTMCISAPVVTS